MSEKRVVVIEVSGKFPRKRFHFGVLVRKVDVWCYVHLRLFDRYA